MRNQRILLASVLLLSASLAKAEVAVSVSVGQPGFYGQIQLGEYYPQPQVIYTQPVIIQRVHTPPPPIYLHVPPGHAKQWARYCGQYGACAQPVYFVQDTWYNSVYVPRYQERYYRDSGRDKGWKDKGDKDRGNNGRGHGRDDR